ncbi:hypothetical protein K458DRAFT_399671 [Lentithecium fluviatile CBS 122367]|uniref:Rhodopsin domain-containing protein n=1 Tax=Lentithecium fluviatile CBS 122367 TaxID=1168545 RepID=A0A6G1JJJ7_9PLEO|nr:hypothetical protein K458DRAFT_399671 [Lentithecium fluviatile CBS 122367]
MFGIDRYTSDKFGLTVASWVLTGAVVGLRIFCKVRHKQGVRADDYWIIVGLCWFWAAGGQLHPPLKSDKMLILPKAAFLGINLLAVSTYAIKMSILFFYVRIFSIETWFRRVSYVVMGLSTAWVIATVVAFCQICQPIDSFWNKLKPGKCVSGNNYFLGTGVSDTILDIIILLLPVRMALQLHLPMRTKVAIAGIFALGGFVVITNIIRLTFMYRPNDNFVNFAETEKWAHIHWLTGIICACLPIYKPLWTSLSQSTGSWISSFRTKLGYSSNKSKNTSYVRMGHMGHLETSTESKRSDLESGYSQNSKSGTDRSNSVKSSQGDEEKGYPRAPPRGVTFLHQGNVF